MTADEANERLGALTAGLRKAASAFAKLTEAVTACVESLRDLLPALWKHQNHGHPGRWSDKARRRRAQRLWRASERRCGLSLKGQVRGFPVFQCGAEEA